MRRALLALLATSLGAACGSQAGSYEAGSTSDAAEAASPGADVLDQDALLARLESRDGPLVLNFWATWCPPCIAELPALQKLAAELEPRGVAVQTVSIDLAFSPDGSYTIEELNEYVADSDLTLPVWAFDGDLNSLASALELPGPIPYTMVFDSTGDARVRHLGAATLEEFREMVDRALGTGTGTGTD